jgi:hypothetical protein
VPDKPPCNYGHPIIFHNTCRCRGTRRSRRTAQTAAPPLNSPLGEKIKANSMYICINQNIETVLSEIPKRHGTDYQWLTETLKNTDVSRNVEFQRKYRSYWVMRYISPDSQFNQMYFSILEKLKNNKNLDFRTVAEQLNSIPHDSEGKRSSFHFSFISKLLHSIDNSSPIYDSMIKDFFYLPGIDGSNIEKKIKQSEIILNFLSKEMARIKSEGLLKEAINQFKKRFQLSSFSDYKIIDSLIWAFVKSARNGGFLNGQLKFT